MAHMKKDILLSYIREGTPMTRKQQLWLTTLLSVPAILSQLSSIIMQYIDASMVGSLGANDSASIGLVSTSLWLLGGICSAVATGFSVQVAHKIGANKPEEARNVLRQGIVSILLFSVTLASIAVSISGQLPYWLGGSEEIAENATTYFMLFAAGIPMVAFSILASGMLRCSGNIKVPSMLNIQTCVLDVIFNFFFIFPTRTISLFGSEFTIPGMGMGVAGAAIGTLIAEGITCIMLVCYMCFKSKDLKLTQDKGSYVPTKECLKKAVKIGFPMGMQHIIMCSAQILITAIVAPLGSIALAANSFAVTAESLCYMPGYGIGDAATTLVGQSIGAKRKNLTKDFALITVSLGMAVMTLMAVLMYLGAPLMMGIMSPVEGIVTQGADALRIEAFAEPFFAASIVSYGVFVGAGDTIVPCGINMVSMWGIRITLSALLAPTMGLQGVWIAMATELTVRGILYLIRLRSGKWIKFKNNTQTTI